MKLVSLIVASLVLALAWSGKGSAHTLVVDDSKSGGMVMHISPDDDPVVNEPAQISLDFQSKQYQKVRAAITGPSGSEDQIDFAIEGNMAKATYTFPSTGTYSFVVSATNGDTTNTFKETRSVNRAADQGAQKGRGDSRTGLLVIPALLLVAALVASIVYRRKQS